MESRLCSRRQVQVAWEAWLSLRRLSTRHAVFIPQTGSTQYLSANLDFTGEAALQALVTGGQIVPSTTVNVPTGAGSKSITALQ